MGRVRPVRAAQVLAATPAVIAAAVHPADFATSAAGTGEGVPNREAGFGLGRFRGQPLDHLGVLHRRGPWLGRRTAERTGVSVGSWAGRASNIYAHAAFGPDTGVGQFIHPNDSALECF